MSPKPPKKLTSAKAHAIRLAFMAGKSIKALAAEYEVSDDTVRNVLNYETWVSAGPPRSARCDADTDD